MLVCGSFGSLKNMKHPDYEPDKRDLYGVAGQGFMGIFLMLALFVGLQIPATVTMVRVAASMLPEEDETIVSFDRTFGGKVTARHRWRTRQRSVLLRHGAASHALADVRLLKLTREGCAHHHGCLGRNDHHGDCGGAYHAW